MSEDERQPELANLTIASLLLASAQAPLGSTMIAVALPSIGSDLHRELALVTSLLATAYLIVNIIGQSPGGKLGDVLGHGRTVRLGMMLQATGAVTGMLAQGLWVLVAARATLALGGALVMPSAIALLRVHVPAERRGSVFGLVGATMGLSAAIGPPLGGELVSHFGWRSMFAAHLIFLALAAVLARVAPLPKPRAAARATPAEFLRGFDWGGTGLFAAGLAALVVGSKATGANQPLALAASVATLTAFVLWELRAKSPVLDPHLFRNRTFTAGSLIVALANFAMYGLVFQLPQFFQTHRGATPEATGRLLAAMMFAMFVASPIGGRVTDRFGSRGTALTGLTFVLAGMLWLGRLGTFQAPLDAVPAVALLGLGLGLSNAPTQAAAMASIRIEQSGMAAGATSTLRYLGGVASILVLSAILGKHGATIESHVTAVHVSTVGAALAFALCFMLPGLSTKHES